MVSFDGKERTEQRRGRHGGGGLVREKGRFGVQLDGAKKPMLLRYRNLIPLVSTPQPLVLRALKIGAHNFLVHLAG